MFEKIRKLTIGARKRSLWAETVGSAVITMIVVDGNGCSISNENGRGSGGGRW